MSILNLSTEVKNTVQQCMDDMLSTNIYGRECILHFPPLQQVCSLCQIDPIGQKPSTIYIHGAPLPYHMNQTCPVCNGNGYLSVESTDTVTMILEWSRQNFIDNFRNIRTDDSLVQSRGYVSDLHKIRNCSFMEAYHEIGSDHYRFKLISEPLMPNKIVKNRYFYALWQRI